MGGQYHPPMVALIAWYCIEFMLKSIETGIFSRLRCEQWHQFQCKGYLEVPLASRRVTAGWLIPALPVDSLDSLDWFQGTATPSDWCVKHWSFHLDGVALNPRKDPVDHPVVLRWDFSFRKTFSQQQVTVAGSRARKKSEASGTIGPSQEWWKNIWKRLLYSIIPWKIYGKGWKQQQHIFSTNSKRTLGVSAVPLPNLKPDWLVIAGCGSSIKNYIYQKKKT